jgi:hypothetical protein
VNTRGGYRAYLEFDVFNTLSSTESSDDVRLTYSVDCNQLAGGALMQDLNPTLARMNNSLPVDILKKRLEIFATSLLLG